MSIEDPRISAIGSENVSHDFRQDIHEDAQLQASAAEGVEVAQAGSQQPEKTDRVPAAPVVAAAEVVPDQNNIAHLPADAAIDDIRIEGNNLVLVQADGTEIVIVNGALHVPTFLLGEVALPQQAVIAALEQSNINVAAGPDGSYSASSAPPSSGAEFQDAIQQNDDAPTDLAQLLEDTQQADGLLQNDEDESFNHLPEMQPITSLVYNDTAEDDNFAPFVGKLPGFDADGNDVLRYSVTGGVPQSGNPDYDIIKVGSYGTLMLNSATGAYTYLPNDGAIEGLKTLQSESFTFTVTDNAGASASQTWTVEVHGTNDTASISGSAAGVVVEDSGEALSAQGQLTVSDRDTGDGHFQEPETEAKTGQYGTFTFNAQTGAWTYALNNGSQVVQGLSAGQTVHDTLVVTSSDGTAQQPITITITGTNDAPVITAGGAGSFSELTGVTGSEDDRTASGTLSFTDVDLNDTGHTASVTGVSVSGISAGLPSQAALLAFMQTGTVVKAAGSATGTIGWNFAADDKTFDYLGRGETVTLRYTVEVDDHDGGKGTQVVTITVTGTNDAPVIAQTTANVTEQAGKTLSLSNDVAHLSIHFSDADLSDTGHSAKVTDFQALGVTSGLNPLSHFALEHALDIDGVTKAAGSANGQVNATFAARDLVFDYLAAGEQLTLRYTIEVNDKHGAKVTQTVDVVVTGTNDSPVIGLPGGGFVVEQAGHTGDTSNDTTSGKIGFADVDLSDGHTASVTGVLATGATGNAAPDYSKFLSVSVSEAAGSATGTIDWTFKAPDNTFDHLAKGEKLTLTYGVTLSDGHGGTDTTTVTVVVFGTNDAPVINGDSQISADVFEKGNLDAVGADMAADHRFEPTVNIDGFLATKLVSGVDMQGLLAQVQQQIGPKASVADAIATVWDYVDDHGSYYNNVLNEMSARLGIEYAKYLEAGGKPLLDVVAKYTPDGVDAGSAPDRLQSLHDNLLGNLDGASLIDKLLGAGQGSNANPVPGVYQAILDLLHANHLDGLLTRPIYSGNEGVTNNALAWDQQHGLVPVAGGQLVATDVDHDAHLTWSIAGPNTYGTISIDPATGKWVYLLIDGAAATQGLNEGETVQQIFTATVTDEHGATGTQQITLTIHGSNDAPVISLEGGDRDFVSLTEGNAGLSADGTLSVSDVDNNDVVAVSVTGVSATGSNIESRFTADQLKGFFSVDSGAVISGGAHAGDIHWKFNSGTEAFNFLPKGWQSIISYTVQVTDSHGGVDTHVVQVKLTGTNDAPVITSAPVSASVTEAGDLTGISDAGSGGGLSAHVALSTATTAAIALIATAPTAANFNAALHGIGHDLPAGGDALADRATAITVLWNALDDSYTSAGANQININQGFTQLGLAYVQYLKDGGAPLTDIIAKYAADGADADTLPDRLQSLHDNLLGNLTTYALTQRYGSDATLFDQYKAQVTAADASLLDRPYHSGTEGSDSDVRTWDQQHGYVSTAHGQFTATDVDLNHTLTWSISGSNTYGAMSIDASTGKWIYQLDDSRAGTQGLGAGETATETYTATVTDEYGATATQQVTITVHGSNDAPVVAAAVTTANYVEPNGSNIGKLDGYKIFSAANGFTVSDADVHNAGYKSVTVTADEGDRLFIRQSDQGGLKLNNGEITITQSEKSSNTLIITAADGHMMTEAEVKAILQKIIFHTGEHTAASETHHIAIVVEDADGGLSAPLGITVNVTGTNDAPTAYKDFSVTTGEDHAFAFTPQSVGDTKITFEDLDDDSGAQGGTLGQLTIASTHGVVTVNLAQYPGLKILSVDGVAVSEGGHGSYTGHSIVVEGAAGKNGPIDQLTDSDHGTGITFNPDANFNGQAIITLSYNDRGDDGLPASASAVQTITVNVTPENDAPHLALGQTTGLTIAEDTRLYFAETGAKNWVSSDPDQPYGTVQTVTLTLHVDAGGTFTASQYGLSGGFNIVTSDDGHTISITTTADSNNSRDAYAILNSLLRGDNHNPGNLNGIAFTPDHDYNGTVNVQYTLDDHGGIGGPTGLTDTGSFSINVTPVNDAPVLDLDSRAGATGNDLQMGVHEQTPMWFADYAKLSDVDSSDLQSLTATLTNRPDGAADTLYLNSNALALAALYHLTVSIGDNGVVSVTGNASVSTYESILRGLVYNNTSDNPSSHTDRVIDITVSDGDKSTTQHATIHVNPINDAPVLAGDLTASVEKGHSYVLTKSDVFFTDPDNTVVTFLVSNQQHGTIQVGGAAATSFTSADLLAGIVTFAHDNSAGNSAGFDIKVEDGNQDGSVPVSQPFHLDVTIPNAAPTVENVTILTDAKSNIDIPVAALLWHAHDAEGSALKFALPGNQPHVSYAQGSDHVNYVIQASVPGFHYMVSDGVNAPVTADVAVTGKSAFVATDHDDFFVAAGNNTYSLIAKGGDDVLIGGSSSTNVLYGDGQTESLTDGNDLLIGGNSATNTMWGGGGDDLLVGGKSATNVMWGGSGDDLLVGGSNATNEMHGGSGNDHFVLGTTATNLVDGDGGIDLLDFSAFGSGVNVALSSGSGSISTQFGTTVYSGIEGVIGTDFNDTLQGNSGENYLYGGAGQNTLTGGDGHDTFFIDASALSQLDPADIITDYKATGDSSDKLDVSSLLDALIAQQPGMSGADALSKLTATTTGNTTTLSITTSATDTHAVATLEHVDAGQAIKILFHDQDHTINSHNA
ncbi:VCBS domain-containing protein [Rhizobium sp. Root1220]|uniref:VCBS domain-containing protein n=1 Tax=Rhizobium sp. Root1220 TaxID=1736432 RepID=UPI0006F7AB91|nr:VCBS domain-containing protein [Rhizobium sp. Root1220]KQV68058.1 hypothetical protein ASC90_10365 [Rhizobium sp. Root1220]